MTSTKITQHFPGQRGSIGCKVYGFSSQSGHTSGLCAPHLVWMLTCIWETMNRCFFLHRSSSLSLPLSLKAMKKMSSREDKKKKLLNIKYILENLNHFFHFFYYICLTLVMLKCLDPLKEETGMVFHYIIQLTIGHLNCLQMLGDVLAAVLLLTLIHLSILWRQYCLHTDHGSFKCSASFLLINAAAKLHFLKKMIILYAIYVSKEISILLKDTAICGTLILPWCIT